MRFSLVCLYICISITVQQTCQAKQLITNPERNDGFGAQFQTIIYSVICAELIDSEFVYTPFAKMEHNYQNDPDFIAKKERLINFIDNFEMSRGDAQRLDAGIVIQFFEKNLLACANSSSLKKIKSIFRANKKRSDYFNDTHFHIAIHMRRANPHDNRIDGTNTPNAIFLNIINKLRVLYASKNPMFHLHSQGNIDDFKKFIAHDTMLHLNESVEDSFIGMVLADALVTSRSSFSYTAAILSEGIVYYMPFWHPPLPGWIVLSEF